MTTEQNDANAVELYRKYRPQKFSEVVGQREAVENKGGVTLLTVASVDWAERIVATRS